MIFHMSLCRRSHYLHKRLCRYVASVNQVLLSVGNITRQAVG